MKRVLSLITMLLCLMPSLWAQEVNEDYIAVLSDNGSTLTFRDNQYDQYDNVTKFNPLEPRQDGKPAWEDYKAGITTVEFGGQFENARPTTTAYWFSDCINLTTISDINYLCTENVTTMAYMFSGCENLETINFDSDVNYFGKNSSNFKTNKVTTMEGMFKNCKKLTSLQFGGSFNTYYTVTNMASMFEGCTGLVDLTINLFNTAKVTDMSSMFKGCSSLRALEFSSFSGNTFYTDAVTDMSNMFSGCSNLTELSLDGFNTASATDMSGMFQGAEKLRKLTIGGNFTITQTTSTTDMFAGCTALANGIVIVKGDTAPTIMPSIFANVITDGTLLTDPLSDILDQQVTSQGNLFYWAGGGFSAYNSSTYAILSQDNTTLTIYYGILGNQPEGTLYRSLRDADENSAWSEYKEQITTVNIDESIANYTGLTSTAYWFNGCTNLSQVNGMEYLNTVNVTDMSYMFYGCTSLRNITLGSNFTVKDAETTNTEHIFITTADYDYSVYPLSEGTLTLKGSSLPAIEQDIFLNVFFYGTLISETKIEGIGKNDNGQISWKGGGFNIYNEYYNVYPEYGFETDLGMAKEGTTVTITIHPDFVDMTPKPMPKVYYYIGETYMKAALTDIEGEWTFVMPAAPVTISQLRMTTAIRLSSDEKTLTFIGIDHSEIDQMGVTTETDGSKTIALRLYQSAQRGYADNDDITAFITACHNKVETAILDETLSQLEQPMWSGERLFYDLGKLTTIEGLENLNMQNFYSTAEMFAGCSSLASLTIGSNFYIGSSEPADEYSSAFDATDMFKGCTLLANGMLTVKGNTAPTIEQDIFSGVYTNGTLITEPIQLLSNDLSTDGNGNYLYKGGVFGRFNKLPHTITITAADNGQVTSIGEAAEGETVTLTVTPDEGYELTGLTITYFDDEDHGLTIDATDGTISGTKTFTMPNYPVTVTPVFTLIPQEEYYCEYTDDGTLTFRFGIKPSASAWSLTDDWATQTQSLVIKTILIEQTFASKIPTLSENTFQGFNNCSLYTENLFELTGVGTDPETHMITYLGGLFTRYNEYSYISYPVYFTVDKTMAKKDTEITVTQVPDENGRTYEPKGFYRNTEDEVVPLSFNDNGDGTWTFIMPDFVAYISPIYYTPVCQLSDDNKTLTWMGMDQDIVMELANQQSQGKQGQGQGQQGAAEDIHGLTWFRTFNSGQYNDESETDFIAALHSQVEKVVFEPSITKTYEMGAVRLFYKFSKLTTIEGLDYLNMKNMGSSEKMFAGCSSLANLTIGSNFYIGTEESGFTTTDMFDGCTSLATGTLTVKGTEKPTVEQNVFSVFTDGILVTEPTDLLGELSTEDGYYLWKGGKFNSYNGQTLAPRIHTIATLSDDHKTVTYYQSETAPDGQTSWDMEDIGENFDWNGYADEIEEAIFDESFDHWDDLRLYLYSFETFTPKTLIVHGKVPAVPDSSPSANILKNWNNIIVLTVIDDDAAEDVPENEDGTHNFLGAQVETVETDESILPEPQDYDYYVAELSEDGETLTFKGTNEKPNQRNEEEPVFGENGEPVNSDTPVTGPKTWDATATGSNPGWNTANIPETIKKVVIDKSFRNAKPTSTSNWFNGMTNITTVKHFEYVNTTQTTQMNQMFYNCTSLTSLTLGKNFSTTKVTSPDGGETTGYQNVFNGCQPQSLVIKGTDVTNITKPILSGLSQTRVVAVNSNGTKSNTLDNVTSADGTATIGGATIVNAKATTEPVETVKLQMSSWVYGDAAKTPVLKGTTATATFMYKLRNAADDTYSTIVPSEAGDYTVRADVGGKSYTKDFIIARVGILKKDITLNNQFIFDYDGKAHQPTVESVKATYGGAVHTLINGQDYEITIKGASNGEAVNSEGNAVNVGVYLIKIAGKGNFKNSYVYSFNIVRNLGITFTEGKNKYCTYYSAEDLRVPDDMEAYTVSSVITDAEGNVTLTLVQIPFIPKEVGIVLWSDVSNSDIRTYVIGVDPAVKANISSKLVGTLEDTTLDKYAGYVLRNDEFMLAGAGTLKANRCYLPMSEIYGNAKPARLKISKEKVDGTTTIEEINTDALSSGSWYDLQGRKVEKPARKGLYINNGKKIVVK